MEFKGFTSAAQADAVQNAIDALQVLLQVKVGGPNTADTSANDDDDASDGSKSFEDHVVAAFPGDDNLKSSAQDFDDAYDAGDGKAMEEAADPIMSAVEEAIEGGADASKYTDISSYLVDAFDDVNDSHDTEATETQDQLAGDASASKGLANDYELEYQFKRAFSPAQREKLAKDGHAMPDGSFPIENEEDVKHAVTAIGRAASPDKAKEHILKRANALGCSQHVPDDWKNKKKESGIDVETKTIDMSEFADILGTV
jgi:flagellar hook-basal body complex protein FliE